MIYEFKRIIVFIKTISKQHEETIQFLIKTCIVYVNELDWTVTLFIQSENVHCDSRTFSVNAELLGFIITL